MTAKDHDRRADLEALQALLEAHGADRSRWPARERLRFAELIAGSGDARRLVAEAEALDRLLDLAPEVPSAEAERLAARIVAAARSAPPGSEMVPAPPRAPYKVSPARRPAARNPQVLDWRAGVLMAASLMLGIFAGTSGLIDGSAVQEMTLAATLSEPETDASPIGLGVDAASLLDEDLL